MLVSVAKPKCEHWFCGTIDALVYLILFVSRNQFKEETHTKTVLVMNA